MGGRACQFAAAGIAWVVGSRESRVESREWDLPRGDGWKLVNVGSGSTGLGFVSLLRTATGEEMRMGMGRAAWRLVFLPDRFCPKCFLELPRFMWEGCALW